MVRISNLIDPKKIIEEVSVEELCQKAEDYFKNLRDTTHSMAKPFGSFTDASETLAIVSSLIDGLKLGKTMTVLDFGAGACWLSRILNQLQCITISVDPSRTALDLGKKLFQLSPIIGDYIKNPQFLVFDGHSIDLPDSSVDRIACVAAFHHVPNQEEVLQELFRVLKPGGIIGFCEPGRNHSKHFDSQEEMRNFRVLENDIILEDIFDIAKRIGFTDLYVKPRITYDLNLNIDEYKDVVLKHKIPGKILQAITAGMTSSTVFFLTKGPIKFDSRSHYGLKHKLAIKKTIYHIKQNEEIVVPMKIKNTGVSKWLISNISDIGMVRVGAQLCDISGTIINRDYARNNLIRHLDPGDDLNISFKLAIREKGDYIVRFDLVSEKVCWFENQGSIPQQITIKVD